jgi:hypothetical protein
VQKKQSVQDFSHYLSPILSFFTPAIKKSSTATSFFNLGERAVYKELGNFFQDYIFVVNCRGMWLWMQHVFCWDPPVNWHPLTLQNMHLLHYMKAVSGTAHNWCGGVRKCYVLNWYWHEDQLSVSVILGISKVNDVNVLESNHGMITYK